MNIWWLIWYVTIIVPWCNIKWSSYDYTHTWIICFACTCADLFTNDSAVLQDNRGIPYLVCDCPGKRVYTMVSQGPLAKKTKRGRSTYSYIVITINHHIIPRGPKVTFREILCCDTQHSRDIHRASNARIMCKSCAIGARKDRSPQDVTFGLLSIVGRHFIKLWRDISSTFRLYMFINKKIIRHPG
jgi:hypothetical protein